VLDHPWFADLDMKALLDRKIDAPYLPKVTDPTDLANFDEEVTQQNL
jgi:citrate lyase beta subunit